MKKYEEGGMVEIEIKVGGGGKRKGMHRMPDGSMMEDDEHEAEEYRKGGKVKKYQKGGAVDDGKDKYPSERKMLEKGLARTRQRRADMDVEVDPTGDREAVMSAPFRVQRPSAFYPLTGRDYVGPRQQMERERARREAEVQRRGDVARRSLEDRIDTMENALSEMGSKENKQNYRKGGMVKPKAPVKKAMGGKVAAKPMAKPVMKKAGGRVAAKPMAKGRKK